MSIYYYCQKCGGTFDPAHTQCPNCDVPDDRDAEIASLRASVERLTAERAAATKLMEFWRSKSRERMAGLDFRRIVASVAVEMDQIGGGGSSASNVRAWSSRLSDALAGLPDDEAESAEATIERLGRVARAAEHLQHNVRFVECRPNCDDCEMATTRLKEMFSSLTPEDRRRAGIEG